MSDARRLEVAEDSGQLAVTAAELVRDSGADSFQLGYDLHPLFGNQIPPGWEHTWRARAHYPDGREFVGSATGTEPQRIAVYAMVDLLEQLGVNVVLIDRSED